MIYRVRYLTFFFQQVVMVTLSSCLIWQIISFILPPNEYLCVYAGKWACDRLTGDADFSKKNYLFRWSSFWYWRACKQPKLCIWSTENPHAYIEKPTHSKRVTVWCRFWSRGIIGPFFFENEQREDVTVNGDRYRAMLNAFCSQKLKRRLLATFGFNTTALRATKPKL